MNHDNYKVVDTLYKQSKNDVVAMFNYDAPNGLVICNKLMQKIVALLDGNHAFNDIVKEISVNPNILQKYINILSDANLIKGLEKLDTNKSLCGWLLITDSCNFRCKYCFVSKNPSNMTLDIAIETIDKMILCSKNKCYDNLFITFAGGEPLLNFDLIKKVVDHYKNIETPKLSYRIVTNGSLINKDIVNYIKENNIDITVSLDSVKKFNDINRYYVDGRGTYEDVIKNIKLLKDNGIVPLINSVITGDNFRYLTKYVKNLIKLNVNFIFTIERAINDELPKIYNYKDEFIKELIKCINLVKKERRKGNNITLEFNNLIFNNSSNNVCEAGSSLIAVNCNGDISCCGNNMRFPVSNIKDDYNLFAMFENSKFEIDNLLECGDCVWKKICHNGCPVSNFYLYGNYAKKSPCCEIYQKILPHVVDMYMTFKK